MIISLKVVPKFPPTKLRYPKEVRYCCVYQQQDDFPLVPVIAMIFVVVQEAAKPTEAIGNSFVAMSMNFDFMHQANQGEEAEHLVKG